MSSQIARKRPLVVMAVVCGVLATALVGVLLFRYVRTVQQQSSHETETSGQAAEKFAGDEGSGAVPQAPVGASSFAMPPTGYWVAYDFEHASEGRATLGTSMPEDGSATSEQPRQAEGPTEVRSSMRLRAFLLYTHDALLLVPARIEAHVAAGRDVLLDLAPAKETAAPSVENSGALEPSLIREALATDGLLVLPRGVVPGFELRTPRFVQSPSRSLVTASSPSRSLLENLVLDAVRSLAFKQPDGPFGFANGASYLTEEPEDEGSLDVRYLAKTAAGELKGDIMVVRTTDSLTRGAAIDTRVVDSRTLTLPPVGSLFFLREARGERTQTLTQKSGPLASNHYTWNTRALGTGSLGDRALLEISLLVREALEARDGAQARTPNLVRQMNKETLGSDTLESLEERLAESAKGKPSESEKTRLYLKLKALLILQPQNSRALAARALEASAGALELQLVAGALSAAGTPEAQAALVEITKAAAPGSTKRLQLVPMLGFAESPTASTLLYLESLADGAGTPEAKTARLSLGIAAHKGLAGEPVIAARIAASFVERLRASSTPGEIVGVLRGGGNTGHLDFLNVAASYLSDSDESVRAAAIFALRLVPFDTFASVYERALTDPSKRVRAQALEALGPPFQKPTASLSALLMRAYPNQHDASLRVTVLQLLWATRGANPAGVKEFVQAVADSSTDTHDVRLYASGLLRPGDP